MKKKTECTSKEYRAWIEIRRRCYKADRHNYKLYGLKGVTVCASWCENFKNFLKDMGRAPSKKHSIDRIDSNGNYEPNNCRWADIKTQSRNKSTNRKFTYNGETKTGIEWIESSGVQHSAFWNRVRLGWDIKDIVEKPVRAKRKSNGKTND